MSSISSISDTNTSNNCNYNPNDFNFSKDIQTMQNLKIHQEHILQEKKRIENILKITIQIPTNIQVGPKENDTHLYSQNNHNIEAQNYALKHKIQKQHKNNKKPIITLCLAQKYQFFLL